ncbi:hypothetical protein BpHYR1_030599 [Brachionus plicatilis]|uniref:Uncharacterized protein n=1 Tax=Brachionus plicatilis TaxID=10195 RepID=A0A3M7R1D7_BRAPC|nr:hypothetical protein BpHYR1_030599 [Brachionus plicatilis]
MEKADQKISKKSKNVKILKKSNKELAEYTILDLDDSRLKMAETGSERDQAKSISEIGPASEIRGNKQKIETTNR